MEFLEEFEARCAHYERVWGRVPLHARAVRKAFESNVAPDDRIRRSRIAAEGTLLFVIRERGGEELFQKEQQRRLALEALIQIFKKNTTLRSALRDLDGWAKVERDLGHVQQVGNRAAHFHMATLHDSLTGGVNDGLKVAVRWAWLEAGIVDKSPEDLSRGFGQAKSLRRGAVAVVQPVVPTMDRDRVESGPSESRGGSTRIVRGVLTAAAIMAATFLVTAMLIFGSKVSGLSLSDVAGDGRTMSASAPAATRPVPNRRMERPRR